MVVNGNQKKIQKNLINGKPDSIVLIRLKNYNILVKYNSTGKSVKIRHLTNHGMPKYHSNPHDHTITWGNPDGSPTFGVQTNYANGVPEFKNYSIRKVTKQMSQELNYSTLFEFKTSIEQGKEICFDYNGKSYAIFCLDKEKFVLCPDDTGESDLFFSSVDDMIDTKIGEEKLRTIITKIDVTDRNL